MKPRSDRSTTKATKVFKYAVAFAPLAILALVAVPQLAPPRLVAPGTKLLYDDFEFSAVRTESTNQIGSHKAPIGQRYLIVDVQVTNRAKRVMFHFDPEVVKVAATGKGLKADPEVQKSLDSLVSALGDTTTFDLSPGQTETYRLVYSAPASVANVQVNFAFGGGVGTALDNVIYGKRAVLVPVEQN